MDEQRFARLMVVLGLLLLPADIWAQTLGSGSIGGIVKDTSGAVLPGVTVEAASPALIEKVRTVVTDDQGQYKIVDLRPGTYTVTFSLPGFSTVKREGVELTTSFTATVNGELRVGALEETITVSGAAPVVDVQNAIQQTTLARPVMDAIPIGRSLSTYASLLPGASASQASGQDVGGLRAESAVGQFGIHNGRPTDLNVYQDGLLYANANNSTFSFNGATMQEVTIETSGMSAESWTGGIQVNIVPKDGGNTFSGDFAASGTNSRMQSNNLTEAIRGRGVTAAVAARRLYNLSAGLGGPIKKNTLWFFTAHRWWGTSQYAPGNYFNATQDSWFYTPDLSRQAYSTDYYQDNSLRLTWQASPKQKISGYYNLQHNCNCSNFLLLGTPTFTGTYSPEALGEHRYQPMHAPAVAWSYVATNKLLFEAGVSGIIYALDSTHRKPGVSTDDISVIEQSTNTMYRSRASTIATVAGSYARNSTVFANERLSVAYITGSHAFKAGLFMRHSTSSDSPVDNEINGSMSYVFRNGVPNSVTLWATPFHLKSSTTTLALFAQDQWTIRQRLTLNLGLRYERPTGHIPEQRLPAGRFVPARNFAAVPNVAHLHDLLPRVGAAYNLFGNGKTAIKVFLGQYVSGGVSVATNPLDNMVQSATRTWNDANGNYVPDCNWADPAANGECGRLSNLLFGQLRPGTRIDDSLLNGWGVRSYNWQGLVSLQHELRPGLALNVGYFRTWYTNFTVTDNLLVTPADYDPYCITAPVDPRLPGGGGQQLCGLYDITPRLFGQADNLVTKASRFGKQNEVFNGVDVTFNARFGAGLVLSGGLAIGRTVTDNCFAVDSPQQQRPGFCHVSPPWSAGTQFKLLAVYPLPWGFQTSATYQNLPGVPILASYVATNAQILPSLGRNLAAGASATATIDLIPSGTLYEDRIQQIDMRFTKIFKVGQMKLSGDFDLYNVLNASPILAVATRYGPAWLKPTQILPGRLFKVGVRVQY